MSSRVIFGVFGLLLVAASSAVEVEVGEEGCPVAKQGHAMLQTATQRGSGTGEVKSAEVVSSDTIDINNGDAGKKKSKHKKDDPEKTPEQEHKENIDELKADAAHKAQVLQGAIADSESTEEKLGTKVKRMGQDLEDAKVVQAGVEQQISSLQSTLGVAKQTADSCLALSRAMREELKVETEKAQQLDAQSGETEADLKKTLDQVANLRQKVAEMEGDLEEVQRVAAQAKQLSAALAAAKNAKHELSQQLNDFKHAMETKMTQLNEENMALRRQLADMDAKFEQAQKAATILRPYTE